MSLRTLCVGIATWSCLIPLPAWALNPFSAIGDKVSSTIQSGGKSLGQGLGEGVVEAIQPALATTIQTASQAAQGLVGDVELRLNRQVDHAGDVASRLISETRGTLDESLLQVDGILEKRILQVEYTGGKLIRQLDKAVDRQLSTADRILKERSTQLGTIVSDSISEADQALEARIEQLDQAVALRLGNVDVIATKQRLGLEQSLLRAGVLLAILIFVVYVLWTLWRQIDPIRTRLLETYGWKRGWGFLREFGYVLGIQLLGAGVAIVILVVLYNRLPFGARAQAQALSVLHRTELDQSMARFDFPRVRFHASQLEILVPEDSAYYQAVATKADLMRDMILRPALLATPQGQSQIVERIQTLERQLGKRADPDLLTLKAFVIWQLGDSKRDEHQAASLCGRALRLSPGGFPLAPLARQFIRRFLHAPYLGKDQFYGRDAESLDELRVLAFTPIEERGFPLAPILTLDRLLSRLDREVTSPYLSMVKAQADVALAMSQLPKAAPKRGASQSDYSAVTEALAVRNSQAEFVLEAWREFDRKLEQTPMLIGKSAVLAIFRVNDATYTRAAWYVENPDATTLAPLLSEIKVPEMRAKLAPPRVGWEKRFTPLMANELRKLAAFQEADRFSNFEKRCWEFENAFVEQALAAPNHETLLLQAEIAAARLGLYISGTTRGQRIPAALTLTDIPLDPKTISPALDQALQTRGLRFL